jgi:ubiquitin carboxyl-terminal hydrolase 7
MELNGFFKQIVIKIDFINRCNNEMNEFRGLVNEGMTCYLNSLLQTMFFIKAIRNAIFKIPTINESENEKDKS